MSVTQLLIPIGSAALRGEVIKVTDRFEGAGPRTSYITTVGLGSPLYGLIATRRGSCIRAGTGCTVAELHWYGSSWPTRGRAVWGLRGCGGLGSSPCRVCAVFRGSGCCLQPS